MFSIALRLISDLWWDSLSHLVLIICFVAVIWLMGDQEAHDHVKSQRLNKCWEPETFLFLANELISLLIA